MTRIEDLPADQRDKIMAQIALVKDWRPPLREEIARLLYGMDQDSIETPLEDASEFVRDDVYDTADQILALPRIAGFLASVEGEPRFFIDHGMIHDRVTGKHVSTEPVEYDEGKFDTSPIDEACALLNSLASADTHPTGGDSTEIEAPASLSGAVPEGQTPNPSSSPAAGR